MCANLSEIEEKFLPGAVEFTVTVLEMPCCLYPVAEDAAEAVTTVGTGGATLFRMTFTVALEDEEILLLLLILVGEILDDIPASALEDGP